MRKRPLSIFLCAVATLTTAGMLPAVQLFAAERNFPASQPSQATHDPAGASGGTQAAASGIVDRQFLQLDGLAGRWTVRQSMWPDPARPPAVDQGTATFTTVLGGRHLRQDLRIDSGGKTFEGLGYIDYDSATGKYDSLWMDVNFPGMIMAHGDYDPATRTYTFTGAVPDPAQRGATSPLREVLHVRDADHFTYEYYEHHGGSEALAIRLEYTRLK